MDELELARLIAAGELSSPQRHMNVSLFDMRITGTGVAFRPAKREWVYRRPENYLTPDFLARCNGLPVIWIHPKGATLDSKEFSDRIVGTMICRTSRATRSGASRKSMTTRRSASC